MTEHDEADHRRRNVLKTLAATGIAGAGLAGASGTSAAQGQGSQGGQGGGGFRRLRFDYETAGTFDDGTLFDGEDYSENVPEGFEAGEDAAFDGELILTDIEVNEAGELVASGRVKGRLEQNPTEQINETFEVILGLLEDILSILDSDPGECPILELEIQPIFLDLLGLQVETETIALDITAIAGEGNLLGNLLCAVAGLLD
jgi:hypothetical protein